MSIVISKAKRSFFSKNDIDQMENKKKAIEEIREKQLRQKQEKNRLFQEACQKYLALFKGTYILESESDAKKYPHDEYRRRFLFNSIKKNLPFVEYITEQKIDIVPMFIALANIVPSSFDSYSYNYITITSDPFVAGTCLLQYNDVCCINRSNYGSFISDNSSSSVIFHEYRSTKVERRVYGDITLGKSFNIVMPDDKFVCYSYDFFNLLLDCLKNNVIPENSMPNFDLSKMFAVIRTECYTPANTNEDKFGFKYSEHNSEPKKSQLIIYFPDKTI